MSDCGNVTEFPASPCATPGPAATAKGRGVFWKQLVDARLSQQYCLGKACMRTKEGTVFVGSETGVFDALPSGRFRR